MPTFTAEIFIIGVNPYVFLPQEVLEAIFAQAGKSRGAIPVKGLLDGHSFTQTLVKFSGHWRLYLNGPMRKAAGKDVGDHVVVELEYDPEPRVFHMHEKLKMALAENPAARENFDALSPSRQKEIVRYIASLKSEASVEKNVERAIRFLTGKERFVGRDGL